MPRRSYDVPPPKPIDAERVIRVPAIKRVRIPTELRALAVHRKAGPMGGRKKPEESPFAYNRGATAAEARGILSELEEVSPEEKQERFSAILQEFNDWSLNEHAALFEGVNLHEKSERLKALIRQELADPENKSSSNVLESWLRELEALDL
ncbi:MAG: hypothetical protein UX98_C0007G0003 [Parcubacteria group bacterium GW2011_GWA2_47_26]|nr:MAG: hypothetical protein UX98_C0007G0003 [Parcubacteria group bacterium GW2011_GWA2_47_26]